MPCTREQVTHPQNCGGEISEYGMNVPTPHSVETYIMQKLGQYPVVHPS